MGWFFGSSDQKLFDLIEKISDQRDEAQRLVGETSALVERLIEMNRELLEENKEFKRRLT